MAPDRDLLCKLYDKLLTLYPKAFREQFGESMGQNFNDLYRERKRQPGRGLSGYILWMFAETGLGIIKERVLSIRQGGVMKTILTNLKFPAVTGFILVVPFMVLEFINRRNFHEGYPIPLFGLMWLLPAAFVLILMPVVRSVRAGNNILARPVVLLIQLVLLALIAFAWTGILIDQLPCFLGVPNCD